MPKNEEGEFELILGNKQLFAVFLVVIILLGVFFSMGYIIGKSASSTGSDLAGKKKEGPPIVVDSGSSSAAQNPSSAGPLPSPSMSPGDVAVGGNETPASAPPVTAAAQPPASAPEKPKPPTAAPPTKEPEPAPVQTAVSEPGSGQVFLQVLAVARPDAELAVETLGKKGFHAMIAPIPNDARFRVLVGPLKDQGTLAKTRTELESIGFKSAFVRKY